MNKYISSPDGNKIVSVVGDILYDNKENPRKIYSDGKGYVDALTSSVWIYSPTKPHNKNKYPYFWFDDNQIQFSAPEESILKGFSTDNIRGVDLATIQNTTTPGENLYNEEAINDMNDAAAIYVPVIVETDDFLKKVVKRVIIDKAIDLNRLKYKMGEKYTLMNMISALRADTKMSTKYFVIWAELLGFDFAVICEDSGVDRIDPLREPVYYLSTKASTMTEYEFKNM